MIAAVKFKVEVPDAVKVLEQGIFDAKFEIIRLAKEKLRREQEKGNFPKEKENYATFWKNPGGRERKQDIATIRARYLRIGRSRSNPLRFTFIPEGSNQTFVKACIDAYKILRRRVLQVSDSKTMFRGIEMYITRFGNQDYSQYVRINNFTELGNITLPPDAVFVLTNVATAGDVPGAKPRKFPYPIAVEAIHYLKKTPATKGYTPRPKLSGKGFFFHTARAIQSKYGRDVSCRFRYIGLGSVGRKRAMGTLAAIEIGRAGLFPARNATPGKNERKRRRAAKKAGG